MDMFLNWQIWVITIVGGVIVYYITKYFDSFISKISKSYKAKMERREEEERKLAARMVNRIDLYIELQNDILYERIEKRFPLFIIIIISLTGFPIWKILLPEIPSLIVYGIIFVLCLFYIMFLLTQIKMRRLMRIENQYKLLMDKVETQIKLLDTELYTSKSKPVSTDLFKDGDD